MTAPSYPKKIFMYPCAGNDISEPVQVFGESYDTFVFVDIKYSEESKVPEIPGWNEVRGSHRRVGTTNASIRLVQDGRFKFRVIDPECFLADYINDKTGRKILVVRRRGFGQYALHELQDGSLSMFMHRGDSPGEGGSNVYYLANRATSHKPISNLLELIKRKMTKPALIASDGSNTRIPELRDAANGVGSMESFNSHGLTWRLQPASEFLSLRTNVWEVSPQNMGHKI